MTARVETLGQLAHTDFHGVSAYEVLEVRAASRTVYFHKWSGAHDFKAGIEY